MNLRAWSLIFKKITYIISWATFREVYHWCGIFLYQDSALFSDGQSVRNWAINRHNGQPGAHLTRKIRSLCWNVISISSRNYTCKLQVPMLHFYKCIETFTSVLLNRLTCPPTIIAGGLWNAWWHYHGFWGPEIPTHEFFAMDDGIWPHSENS